MTAALLTYRPENVRMLGNVMGHLQKEEAKRRFIGDTLCGVLAALAPGMQRESYGEFARRLDDAGSGADSRTGRQIVDDLVARLKKRRSAGAPV